MRDHPAHTAPMMGGMWGARLARARPSLKECFRKMLRKLLSRIVKFDQILNTHWSQLFE